jgi:hypothetical protein
VPTPYNEVRAWLAEAGEQRRQPLARDGSLDYDRLEAEARRAAGDRERA